MTSDRLLKLPLEIIFTAAGPGMVLIDPDGKILESNASFAKTLGYTSQEIRGRYFPDLFSSGTAPLDNGVFRRLIAGTQPPFSTEVSLTHKNGDPLRVSLNAIPVRSPADGPSGTLLTMTELASLKVLRDELDQFDPLTGLCNRPLFHDRLQHALARSEREKRQIAVLSLGIDRFKEFNDSFGYPAGDRMLKNVADRITAFVRRSDTVARFGSDVFTVLIEGLNKAEYASAVAQKLIGAFAHPFAWQEHEIYLGVSIGISVFPEDGADGGSLMKNAESAMHQSKREGGNGFRFYTPELNTRARERLTLHSELHRALDRGEFVLHYQPLLRTADARVCGMEALLRWNRPGAGLVPPLSFIPLLEETGLIVQVGEWILNAACRHIKALRARGQRDLRVAVNISARQFLQKDFIPMLERLLTGTGVEPLALEVEITESVLIKDTEASHRTLDCIAGLGIGIAIDDFGTGYSSLSYLKRYPVDTLKIDRSFVRGIPGGRDDVAIADAILALAASLGLKVIAEGVETEDQLRFLRERRCHEVQGFLFAKPMPPEELDPWLLAHRGGQTPQPRLPTLKGK
jgi:diguanylate cyclase (GGDEF)-like protein/PAS domain S-box-containing protein